jgi:hypothetical protein
LRLCSLFLSQDDEIVIGVTNTKQTHFIAGFGHCRVKTNTDQAGMLFPQPGDNQCQRAATCVGSFLPDLQTCVFTVVPPGQSVPGA